MINTLIVDDHELVRGGLKKLLFDATGIKVVGEADSGEEAIMLTKQLHPHVVIMDMRMPGIGGLEATRRLLRLDPDLKIIGLSAFEDQALSARILQAGAMGFLTKDCDINEIMTAIRKVYAGQRYLSPDVAQQLALGNTIVENRSPMHVLSERELQIMQMIVHGQDIQQVSRLLNLSAKTVSSHRYRIFAKLGVENDVQLTHVAVRYGMLDDVLSHACLDQKMNTDD